MMTTDNTHADETSEETHELPEGWAEAFVRDLVEITSGKYIQRARYDSNVEGKFPVAGAGGPIGWTDECNFKAPILTLGRVGAAGAVNLYSEDAWVTDNALVVTPKVPDLLNTLRLFFLTVDWSNLTTGSTQPLITQAIVNSLPILLAPLAEQKRIVAKVEALLARVCSAREKLARVPQILKRFRQAILSAACSGSLTEDWRSANLSLPSAHEIERQLQALHTKHGTGLGGKAADPTEGVHDLVASDLPDTWALMELKWLCAPGRPITYGILKPGPDQPNGIPYVRVADFPRDRINVSGVKRTTKEIAHEYRRSMLWTGDVLLSIRGTAGRVCRVPAALNGANITQDTARISVSDFVDSTYVEWCLRSPSVQHRLERAMKGVAVRGVNIGDVRALQMAIPPLAEQHEIVRRVEALFRLADAIQARVTLAIKRAEKLTQAIPAKAFRGELVPTEAELARQEGRDYEPASILLDRIRAQRSAVENGMQARKSQKPRSGRAVKRKTSRSSP